MGKKYKCIFSLDSGQIKDLLITLMSFRRRLPNKTPRLLTFNLSRHWGAFNVKRLRGKCAFLWQWTCKLQSALECNWLTGEWRVVFFFISFVNSNWATVEQWRRRCLVDPWGRQGRWKGLHRPHWWNQPVSHAITLACIYLFRSSMVGITRVQKENDESFRYNAFKVV